MMAGRMAGKPMAMDAAAYTGALEQARALACPVVGCAVDAQGMTAESLRAACVRGRAAGLPVASLFCTVTVHNPLGCTASLENIPVGQCSPAHTGRVRYIPSLLRQAFARRAILRSPRSKQPRFHSLC